MQTESWFYKVIFKILRKLKIIDTQILDSHEMCKRAIKSNVCPHACEICAWGKGMRQ